MFDSSKLEIIDTATRKGRNGVLNVSAALVDDPNTSEMKLVVMFDEPGTIAVLSLNALIDESLVFSDASEYESTLRTYFNNNKTKDK